MEIEQIIDNYKGYISTEIGIIKTVCANEYNVKVEDLAKPNRTREVCDARKQALFFALLFCKSSEITLEFIGKQFNKDHATVMHARKTGLELISTDFEYRTHYNTIHNTLTSMLVTMSFNEYMRNELLNNNFTYLDLKYSTKVKNTEVVRRVVYSSNKKELVVFNNGELSYKKNNPDSIQELKEILNEIL